MAGGVELATAYVSLVVEGSKVAPGVRSALGTADGEASRAGDRAGRSFTSKFGSALKIGATLGAAFAVTKGIQFLGDAIDEAREASVVTARTASVIKSMGNVAGISAKQVAGLAGAISNKVGIDDEAIQSGENLLLTFGKIQDSAGAGNDIFTQTTGLMVDMSVAMDQDMKSSAIQLGKALNDPIKGVTALSRVGVSFTEDQIDTIKALTETNDVLGAQKIILGEVKKQFGGAGEAMATPAEKAQVAWDNLKEQIGTELLPTVDKVLTWFSEKGVPAVANFFDEFDRGKGTAGDIRDMFEHVKDEVVQFFDEFKNHEGFGGDVRDLVMDVRDIVKAAAGYAADFVSAFNDMPDWGKKVILAGGLVGLGGSQMPGLSGLVRSAGTQAVGSGVGSMLGKAVGVQKVFETNPAALGGGTGVPGAPGSKVPPVVGPVSAGALMTSPLALAIFAGVTGYFANKVTPNSDKAPASSTPFAEGMAPPGDAFNFGAEGTDFLKQAAGMQRIFDAVEAGVTTFGNLKGAVKGADDGLAQMIARNPDKAVGKLQQMAALAGVSVSDLTNVLPKTADAMDKAGYSAEGAKIQTDGWMQKMIGLGNETDKVDGKKPKVPFEFPGLAGGIDDILTAGQRTDDVGRKRPKVPFEFPNLTAGLFNVQSLGRSIDSLHDKTITITTQTVGTPGGRTVDDYAVHRAMGGPVYPGKEYMVGERGPERVTFGRVGHVTPNNQLVGGSATFNLYDADGVLMGTMRGVQAQHDKRQRQNLLAARRV